MWKGIRCGLIKLLCESHTDSQPSPGDADQCKNHGGIGMCPSVPGAVIPVKQKLCQLAIPMAHEKTAAAVSATARGALETRAAAEAAGAAGAANGSGKKRGHRNRWVRDALLRRALNWKEAARCNYRINASHRDVHTEAMNPGFAFATT